MNIEILIVIVMIAITIVWAAYLIKRFRRQLNEPVQEEKSPRELETASRRLVYERYDQICEMITEVDSEVDAELFIHLCCLRRELIVLLRRGDGYIYDEAMEVRHDKEFS